MSRARAMPCLALCLLVAPGCRGFDATPDRGVPDLDPGARDGSPADRAPGDLAAPDRAPQPDVGPCPPSISPPTIDSFSVTDGIDRVVFEQPVSLVVTARPAIAGQPLRFRYTSSPSGGEAVDNGDGTARWSLTAAPLVFFSAPFEITAEVTHACGGPAATASVTVSVAGNVLVADHDHGSIEVLASNGSWLGQLVGPAVLTAPKDLALLGPDTLAVGDSGPKLVKIIDLSTQTLARSFGGTVEGLDPSFLERDAGGGVLVGPVNKNQLARFDAQGKLIGLLEAPHPYTIAGLARRADGTVIVGTSGIGRLYAFSAAGASLGLWADVPGGSDTNSLLALEGGELLAGLRAAMNDGLLARLSLTGTVLQTVDGGPPSTTQPSYVFYFLERFEEGQLFVKFKDPRIFRLDAQLAPEKTPFATLAGDAWPMGIAWLDLPP